MLLSLTYATFLLSGEKLAKRCFPKEESARGFSILFLISYT